MWHGMWTSPTLQNTYILPRLFPPQPNSLTTHPWVPQKAAEKTAGRAAGKKAGRAVRPAGGARIQVMPEGAGPNGHRHVQNTHNLYTYINMYTRTPPAAWDPLLFDRHRKKELLLRPWSLTPPGLCLPPASSPGTDKEAMEPQKAIPEKIWKFWKTSKICVSRERPTPFVTHTKSHYHGYRGDSQESPDILQGFPSLTTFLHMDIAHDILYHWPLWGYPLKGFLDVQIQDYSIVW